MRLQSWIDALGGPEIEEQKGEGVVIAVHIVYVVGSLDCVHSKTALQGAGPPEKVWNLDRR